METQEEYQVQQMIKGKRTKRQRPPSPFGIHMVSGSSGSGGYDQSPTTSAGGVTGSSTEKEEDQDMANCLILLAQGRYERSSCPVVAEKIITTTNTVTVTAESLYVYQCKTCDRCFPSFQALGGHRASHKKPKNKMNYGEGNDGQFRNVTSTILSLQMSSSRPPATVAVTGNVKAKVHECSICRAEFSSGQALGGHMRRHRTTTTTTAVAVAVGGGTTSGLELKKLVIKKERNVLELDLNLPAPEDDRHRAVAAVFSASPLVDCHY